MKTIRAGNQINRNLTPITTSQQIRNRLDYQNPNSRWRRDQAPDSIFRLCSGML
jgi:hypothetical protein